VAKRDGKVETGYLMENRSGSLAIGVLMPDGFLATGSISLMVGFGLLGIGDIGDRQGISRKWE